MRTGENSHKAHSRQSGAAPFRDGFFSHGRLTLFFVLMVFFILLCSLLTAGLLFILAFRLNVLPALEASLRSSFLLIAAISLILGFIFSAFFSQYPLHPVKRMIDGMEQLSAGNFAVRLPVSGMKEVRQVQEGFNKMAAELGSMEIMRMDFVNNFSHEFKTPLASIRGFARLLKYEDLPAEEQREYLDNIIAETDRMSRLADRIMLLSRLDHQQILREAREFNLTEQLRRVVLLLEPKLSEKEIDLVMELHECRYVGSEELLQQVWINLLDNAVKFSPPGGRITLSLYRHGEQVCVSVCDQGCGMTPEVQAHIFEKFYQGDSSHAMEGHGVGLAIVRRIVDLSGGTAHVESTPGVGSCFRIDLPLF